jgi:hypothetical protein
MEPPVLPAVPRRQSSRQERRPSVQPFFAETPSAQTSSSGPEVIKERCGLRAARIRR